jgi:hypothetical protein
MIKLLVSLFGLAMVLPVVVDPIVRRQLMARCLFAGQDDEALLS